MFAKLTKYQSEIIKISLKLISEKGIQGLTIKNIARKNGTVESAIYRHFSSKKQILHAIIDILKNNSLPENYLENENTLNQIEKTLKKHFKSFESFPAIAAVLFSEDIFKNDDSLTNQITEMTQNGSKKMEEIINHGQEKGEIRTDISSECIVIIISGSFRMFLKKWKNSNYSFDLIKKGEELISSIKTMITPCNVI